MKILSKALLPFLLVLCLLTVPFAASAEAALLDLMPADESGYTIVEGDGTVAIEDGKLILTNNGDGDFRVWINNATAFDLAKLNALHMQFEAEIPFKMAYHLISNADASSDWVTTTTDFYDLYEVDALTDRNPVGTYDLEMDLNTACVEIADTSSVYFEQFIILVTGKGSLTLRSVEMIAQESTPSATDEPATDSSAEDNSAADADESENNTTAGTTTTKKTTSSASSMAMPLWLPIVITAVVVVVATVCIIVIVKRNKS